ncbi:MAG: amino acid adenylation domain-containing protein, partial [Nannocystaceae bacterium]|nr:amino acid adenylation domain-containing protein [Nannocystaceae bacterium]
LVVRTDCSGDPPFLELIARVREICLGAYDNQDVPFERLVDALQPERDLSQSPLFQVFFDFQNIRLPQATAAGVTVTPVPVRRQASQFDLSFGFLDYGEGMLGSVEFRTDLFDRSTIERMVEHMMRVLEGAVEEPATRLSRLPMFSAAERAALIVAPNQTSVVLRDVRPVHERLAAVNPARVAVLQGGESLTYGALEAAKNRLAHHLRALGVGPDVCVAVFLERTPSLLVALLGTLQAGGAYVPMDPTFPAKRLAWMLQDANPRVIVTQRALATRLPESEIPVVLIDEDAQGIAAHPTYPPATARLTPENLAYVIFTSGSTGRPKGVMVPHRALTNFLQAMAREPGCGPNERLLAVTTVSFDIAALELLLPLTVGAAVDLATSELTVDAHRLARYIEQTRPTMMQATPATWRMLIETGWRGDPELRILSGGEALPRDLANALVERGKTVWNMYGPTETTIWSAVHRVVAGDGPVPLGHPIQNTALYVLDPNGAPVPLGTTGELYIGGVGVASGYLGRETLTHTSFVPDRFGEPGARLYRTGDAVRRAKDGALHLEGRLDEQVKLRGFRIELSEIEVRLRAHPMLHDAACRIVEQTEGDARLIAYVVPVGQAPPIDEMRRHLVEVLPHYMIPSSYVVLDEFPRTANGKLDRGALLDPAEGPPQARAQDAAETALEMRPVALWQDVLGVAVVGVTDDFFDLGGHSLLALRLFVRIAEQEGVSIPIGVLFEAATVRTLAVRIEAMR